MTPPGAQAPPTATRWQRAVDEHGLFATLGAVALLLLLIAYSNHFGNAFHFDDSHTIVDNLAVRNLDHWPRFFTDPHTFSSYPKNALYRPLLTLSYALDYARAGGLDPAPFHRTQFVLLVLLGVTLVAMLRRLLDQVEPSAWNRYVALFAATWFSIHTANTETVNYLSSRSSLAATLAVALALWIYQRWPGARRFHLYLLPIVIGGLAKPLTVMFAPILFAYVLLIEQGGDPLAPGSREGRARLRAAAKRSLPAFVVGGALFVFLSSMNPDTVEYSTLGRWDYLLTQPFVWLHYVRLFFLPLGLTADTDWRIVGAWYDTRVIAGTVFLVALAALTVRVSRNRRTRPAAFGLVWFAVALVPTSSVVPLAEVYNEHRIFFPYVGLTLAVSWLGFLALQRWTLRRAASARSPAPWIAALVVGILLAHGVGTYARNRVWRTEESLWRDVAEKSPANGRGLMNYGLALMRRGKLDEALAYYERARLLTPNYAHLEVNLGVVKGALGRPAEAEDHFRRAMSIGPGYAGAYQFYGRWLVDQGRAREAIDRLETAVALSPTDPAPRELLLRLYVAAGNEEQIRRLAGETLDLFPDDPLASAYAGGRLPLDVSGETPEDFRRAGRGRIDQGAWLDAAAILRHALSMEEDSAVAWNNLGWARLNLGLPELAAPCFRRAWALDPTMEVARNNLLEAERKSRAASSPSVP